MTRKLKVAHLVSSESGGAAKAAYRLHTSLLHVGIDSQFFSCSKSDGWMDTQIVVPEKKNRRIVRRMIEKCAKFLLFICGRDRTYFDLQWTPRGIIPVLDHKQFDVIHFHWVDTNVASLDEIMQMSTPIVWTLHDMRAFTGGYYYLGPNLNRWMSANGKLSAADAEAHFLIRLNLRIKRMIYRAKAVSVIAPSEWMRLCAEKSGVFDGKIVRKIFNGIDSAPWQEADQNTARMALGIDTAAKVVLFGADLLSDSRKGGDLLMEALRGMQKRADILVVTFGGGEVEELKAMGQAYRSFGRVLDEAKLALIYASADVFVAPSREDNLPNVVLESLASGTPVVAFHIGGMPDMISDGITGRLVEPFCVEKLTDAIQDILAWSERGRKDISAVCRQEVSRHFSNHKQRDEVLELYQELLAGQASHSSRKN